MNTGMVDPKVYRQFNSLFNKSFITFNQSYYDGEEVKWDLVSPWAEVVPIQGTDGFAVPPSTKKDDKPVVFISNIARFASVKSQELTIEKFGL